MALGEKDSSLESSGGTLSIVCLLCQAIGRPFCGSYTAALGRVRSRQTLSLSSEAMGH